MRFAEIHSEKGHLIVKYELKAIKHHLCSRRDMSRRPDVHGAEEALLSAHLAAGLDLPPLEAVL